MTLRRLLSGLAAAAFVTTLGLAPTFAQPAATPPVAAFPIIAPAASTFDLANGLQVVVIPDHRAPVVTQMVYYKAGAADEQPGRTGIAHFLEHLMFKGTVLHPDGEFSNLVAAMGGDENAFTSSDTTVYWQTVAKEFLPDIMALEADRMANLQFPDNQVLPERDVILEERNTRVDNDPGAMLSEAVMAAFFRNSPYRNPVIGWRHEMEKLDGAMAIEWYDTFYTPNNAILVIAGDVTEEEIRTLAEATYGKVERRAEPPPRDRPSEPPPLAIRDVRLIDERVTQPSVSISFLAPSYTDGDGREGLALDLLSDILGTGPTSRLYRTMVLNNGIATGAYASYSGGWIGEGRFVVSGVPKEGVTLDEIVAKLNAAIEEVKADGVTEEELARARKRVLATAIFSQDSQSNMARLFGGALSIGQTMEDIKTLPARIQEITVDEVNAAARAYLDTRSTVIGRLESPPAAAPAAAP